MMSHPVWVCGLKPILCVQYRCTNQVTPCMGVWIETSLRHYHKEQDNVTPCMGVWIETAITQRYMWVPMVTPCMGVWIETSKRPSVDL